MELHLDTGVGHQIQSYTTGCVRINETDYQHSVLVSAAELQTDWPPQQLSDLTLEHCQLILNLKPELVLLGTGETWQMPAAELQAFFGQQGIGFEVMDSAAACRTYNLLMAEDRAVVAALLLR